MGGYTRYGFVYRKNWRSFHIALLILYSLFEGNKNDINSHNKLIINAANKYIIADGIALAGAVGGIALADDPIAASQVIAISSTISFIIRMSGHLQLAKAGDTPI